MGLGNDENLEFLNKVSEHFIPKKSQNNITNTSSVQNQNDGSFLNIQDCSFTNPKKNFKLNLNEISKIDDKNNESTPLISTDRAFGFHESQIHKSIY